MDQDLMLGVVGLVVLAVIVVVAVFYLLSLQKALTLAGEENRGMKPGMVWLNLIPVFNLGWIIYTVVKVADAVRRKHAANDFDDPSIGAQGIGIAFGVLNITSIIPVVGVITALAGFVCWIIHWVKIAGYNTAMAGMQN